MTAIPEIVVWYLLTSALGDAAITGIRVLFYIGHFDAAIVGLQRRGLGLHLTTVEMNVSPNLPTPSLLGDRSIS